MDNKLQDFMNKNNCFFIHYASDGFYSGSAPAPRISCIVIYNPKTGKDYCFYIKDKQAKFNIVDGIFDILLLGILF